MIVPVVMVLAGGAFAYGVKAGLDSVNPQVPPDNAVPARAAATAAQAATAPGFAGQVQKYADATGEWWPLESTAHPRPADARLVPILPATLTKLEGYVGPAYWWTDKHTMLSALNCIRDRLREVGRGDEDPRCVMCRCAIETAWGRSCQRRAWGNVKKHAWTSRAMILSQRQVYTDTPESEGVHLLTDNGGSFDAYSSFHTDADYFHYQARFLDRNYGTIPAIAGARAGFRLGGLEGVIASERRLQYGAGNGGAPYAGSSAIPREARLSAAESQARSFWRLALQKVPAAEWVR